MQFPLVPLPNFLLNWYPKLQELHSTSGEILGVVCVIVGLLIIMLWAGNNPDEECPFGGTVRNRMQMGFIFLGVAIFAYTLGLYFTGLLFVALCAYVLYAVSSSARVIFFRRTN